MKLTIPIETVPKTTPTEAGKVWAYKQSEADIKLAVKDYLAIRGIFSFPLLQGIASYKGLPDRVAHLNFGKGSEVVYLEIKKFGGKLSKYQEEFRDQCYRDGIHYLVIHSLEELVAFIWEVK